MRERASGCAGAVLLLLLLRPRTWLMFEPAFPISEPQASERTRIRTAHIAPVPETSTTFGLSAHIFCSSARISPSALMHASWAPESSNTRRSGSLPGGSKRMRQFVCWRIVVIVRPPVPKIAATASMCMSNLNSTSACAGSE